MADIGGSLKNMANLTGSTAYHEEAFRYLLESESERSKCSGHSYQILLVFCTNARGVIVPMDSEVARRVIAALSQTLRDTDYIGWFCEELVVGAVLTVLTQESVAQRSSHIQRRVAEALQWDLPIPENHRLQIRVCQHHELEGVELGALSGRETYLGRR